MDKFETEVINPQFDNSIVLIRTLMSGVNVYYSEYIVRGIHRIIIQNPNYVHWVVNRLLTHEKISSGRFMNLLEDKSQLTREHIFGYYRSELQYELDRNKSLVARQINVLVVEKEKLGQFIADYRANSAEYGEKFSNVLDVADLFNYIIGFL